MPPNTPPRPHHQKCLEQPDASDPVGFGPSAVPCDNVLFIYNVYVLVTNETNYLCKEQAKFQAPAYLQKADQKQNEARLAGHCP